MGVSKKRNADGQLQKTQGIPCAAMLRYMDIADSKIKAAYSTMIQTRHQPLKQMRMSTFITLPCPRLFSVVQESSCITAMISEWMACNGVGHRPGDG